MAHFVPSAAYEPRTFRTPGDDTFWKPRLQAARGAQIDTTPHGYTVTWRGRRAPLCDSDEYEGYCATFDFETGLPDSSNADPSDEYMRFCYSPSGESYAEYGRWGEGAPVKVPMYFLIH